MQSLCCMCQEIKNKNSGAIYYRKSGLTFCFGVILKKAIGWIYFEKFSYFDTLVYFEMITIKFRTALLVYTLFRSSQKF